ncbi:MAG: MoxR family ATPase [Chthonomonas sp.]|nr:MoxR family ATPase [Chthonomonas sp.]
MKPAEISSLAQSMIHEVEKAIVGKDEVIRRAVLALLCNGHLLLEDIPGVGKTTLAKALAKTIGGEFLRVQFTADLLPSDITGTSMYHQHDGTFEFRPGPVFGNIVLVDEVNRATPKTQAALLEAMEERQVSTDGITRKLPQPFFVIATQNNIEMTGTYPLPEAQLDRFFGRLSLGYPDRDAEMEIVRGQQTSHPLESVQQVCDPERMVACQAGVREVHVSEAIRQYVVDIVRATRGHSLLVVGASPRGSLMLSHAAQAAALLAGSDYVRPEDVKSVAAMVLSHRIIARGEVRARGMTNEQIVAQLLDSVPVPLPVSA